MRNLVFLLIVAGVLLAGPPQVVWNKVYDSGEVDEACGVVVDSSGNVYVTGGGVSSYNGMNVFLTIRYDKEGNLGWNTVYDSGDGDKATDVAVDAWHYVYVTGASYNGTNWDFRTIKYQQDDIPAV